MTDKRIQMTEGDVVHALLGGGLLDTASVVDGDVRLHGASRRNVNFRLVRRQGPSLMLKSARRGVFNSVGREARVYQTLAAAGRGARPPRFLPRMYAYDAEHRLLALELFRDAEDMREYHRRRGRFPTGIAASMGRTLAALHCLTPGFRRASDGRCLEAPEPASLQVHRPGLPVLHDFSPAGCELLRLVQRSRELCAALDAMRDDWRRDTLIHQDARWDNTLVIHGARGRLEVRLVDWEAAGLGDAAWDVGSILGDYLGAWIGSIPLTGHAQPGSYLGLARHPLSAMQPAMRRCWASYVRAAQVVAGAEAELRVRAARYAGLKLIQSSLEYVQGAPECTMTAVTLLQVGTNMILRPCHAATVLLGLDDEAGMSG
jgi:hypothetical protein